MYTQEQLAELIAQKHAELSALVASNIITQEQVAGALELYAQQLQQEPQVQEQPQPQPQVPVQPQEQEVNLDPEYSYKEITELHLLYPLSDEEYSEALVLINKIQQTEYSFETRVKAGGVVSDAELDELNRMRKAFKKLTNTGCYTAIKTAQMGLEKVKDIHFEVVNQVDTRSQAFVQGVEDTICDVINDTGALATQTVQFASSLSQGLVKTGGKALRGTLKTGLGLFKRS